MSRPWIGFAGMTHLGLVSAAAVCSKGFPTVCYDADAELVDRLDRGRLAIVEPGLEELIEANGDRQTFTAAIGDLGRCDVVYVAADVPTDDEGRSELSGIGALIEKVAAAMGEGAVMVVLSQVPPGFTRDLTAVPAERLYYQVETLIFGRAVERATRPERHIVGCADPDRPLDAAFAEVLEAMDCPLLTMGYESAELAKISINMCLVASISVANTMAELCEKLGAVWPEIVPALKLDERIGPHAYLKPGLGIAGGNLERDLATVLRLAETHHTDGGVVRAWIGNSRHRRDWAARTIRAALLDAKPDATVAVWGLAYKENTDSVRNSPALATIAQLGEARVRVHDPAVPAHVAAHPRAERAGDPLEAARGADALMILTPWPQYREIAPAEIARALSGRVLLDPYAVLDGKAVAAAGLDYYSLGMAPIPAA